jgi:hypothetical protein
MEEAIIIYFFFKLTESQPKIKEPFPADAAFTRRPCAWVTTRLGTYELEVGKDPLTLDKLKGNAIF